MGFVFGELLKTKLGPISFMAGDQGLLRVSLQPLKQFKSDLGIEDHAPSLYGLEVIGIRLTEVNEYLCGLRKTFSIKIDWDAIKGFQLDVLKYVEQIPFGALITYGHISRQLGRPGSARAVGQALGANPMPIIIPCHRVISSDYKLNGYKHGLESKARLLGLEGHRVEGGRILR